MRSVLLSDDLDTIMDASSAATTTTPDAWDGAHSHRRPELRKHKTMKTIDELVADHKALENRVPNRPIQNDAKSGNQQTNNSKAFQMLRDYEMATSILESRNRADFARRRPHIAFENQRIKLDKTFRTAPGGVKLQLDMAIPEEDDDDNTVRRVLRSQSTALLNKDMNTMMSSSSSGNDSSRDNDSGRQARKKKTVSFQDETPSSTLSTLSTPPSPFALPVDDVHSAAGRRQQQHHMDQSRCDDDGTGQGNGHISSPIHAACYKGDHVTVQHLLGHYSAHEATKLVNSLCTCGMTPLQVACDQGHARVAKFLLRRQARVDARSSSRPHSSGSNSPVSPPSGFAAMGVGKKRHRSCLALAASRRSLDSIELLLDNGAKLDEDALVTACSLGDTAIVHALVQSTAKKFAGFDKLWTPSSSNSSNSSDSTLDPSWIANAAAIAVVNAHAPVLNVLLGDGQSAASRARITTCALDAAAVADYKLLRFLTKVYDHALLKPAHDAHGNSLLHLAVKQASTKCVTLLIRLGVDVDARDALGITPLYMACARGQHAIVRLLVHAGAACVRMGPNDETPLHIAAQENHLSCVSLLLADAHAPVDATTLDKCTALHLACQRGNTLVAKCLLDHGADVNARTVCDETPLLKASRMNNMETVKLLLARNAEIATSSTSSLSSCDESVAHQYEPVTASTSSSVFSTGRSDGSGGVDTHSGRRSVISLAPTTNNQLPPPAPAHAHQPTPLTRSTSKDKDGQDKSHAHSIKGWFKSVVKGHKH